jgi:Cytochrome c7 and related cytochrome c
MRKRITLLSLPVLTLIIFLGLYFFDFSAHSSSQGPIQPVRFSHKIHAGMDNDQLPCQYCHSYVDISPNPGIPSMKKCMGCHTHIVGRDVDYDFDGTTINIKNQIAIVRDYWAKQEPIAWNKVNSMPGYVHFTHKRHIQRGFECKTCHGDIANMNQVHQVNRFDMGFCIQCHMKNAKDQEELTHLKDCLTCHY